MGRERNNTFRKALRHLKSSQIDEKLQLLSEIPTNNTTGIYVIEPESIVQDPDIPGEVTREANFDQDALNNGRDTTGLFDVDNTTILTIEPPGDTTYILGPMSAMWYAWGNFSTIGYIRQSDRRMVDLGRITGQLGSWNGSSNFTSYGQLSLEQAVWFRDTPKHGADNDTPNYRAFYPGPPSNAPDQYGRYLCVITGTSKETTVTPPPRRVPPVVGGFDPNILPGSANPFNNLGKLFGEIGDIFNKILKGPEEFFPKGTLVGNALQNVMKGGVNYAAEYNALLPVYLGLSILTGQKLEIPISPSAAKNMVGKIDANALSNVLKINTSTPTNARETINPTSGKTTSVMKDSMGWGAQGGLTYNYNTKTSQLEITSNKTLRTTSGGETVKTATKFGGMASPGKITSFSDIPSPTIPQVQDTAIKLISAVSTKLGGPGLDPNLSLDIQLSDMRNTYNSNDISRVAVELGLTLSKTMTQGAASNIVALRKVLVDNGIVPKSDVEKIGGAYGQVSNVYKVDYTDLSKDVKNVIDKKTKANEAFILSESKKSILKNIKKPYVLPEQPKQKYKIKLSHNNKNINVDLMKKAEVPSSFKKAEDKMWGKYEKEQNARMSQERKNEVLDHLGGSDHFWEFMTETSRSKNKDIQYTNFDDKSEKVKGKIVRKEELKGDHLVFLKDEKTNEKKTMLQSEINELLAQENMPDEFKIFFEQQNETERYDQDPLFKKVSKRLKKEIDYPDKPAKNGYPNDPPPEMVNGMHPDLVDGKKTMETKKYDWRKELNEQMTTSDVFFTNLPATGDVNLAFPAWNILNGQGYNLSGGTVTITGSGEITDGVVASFDSSIYSNLVFDVNISGDTLLGVFPSGSGGPLLIAQSSGTYSINITQSSALTLLFVAPGLASGNASISNLRFQRKTPLNVFISLDSPEATSFIRTDSIMSNLSPAERLQKLKELLASGDEYVGKILGADFPGTGAVPPGEYDPFKQAPAGEAGDTPGVEISNFDTSKMEKDYGQVAGSMNTPSGATKFMKDLMKDGFGGNVVKTTVNGQRMTGRPAEILQQIQLNFPGGV